MSEGSKIITDSNVTVYGPHALGVGMGFGVDKDGNSMNIVNISAWDNKEDITNESDVPAAVSLSVSLEAALFIFEKLGYIIVPLLLGNEGGENNEDNK